MTKAKKKAKSSTTSAREQKRRLDQSAHANEESQSIGEQKLSARKRSANSGLGNTAGAPPQEQDPKRRLGTFTGTGEHSRVGGRTKGIVGHAKRNVRKES